MSHSELAGRNRSVSGQDRKFPPAPGTNQIAGFREFRPLTSQEKNKYMLFAGWEVRIVETVTEAAFSSLRSQFFTMQTHPKPVNNLFIFFQALKRKKKTLTVKKLMQVLL